jgi:hypothetical protein
MPSYALLVLPVAGLHGRDIVQGPAAGQSLAILCAKVDFPFLQPPEMKTFKHLSSFSSISVR